MSQPTEDNLVVGVRRTVFSMRARYKWRMSYDTAEELAAEVIFQSWLRMREGLPVSPPQLILWVWGQWCKAKVRRNLKQRHDWQEPEPNVPHGIVADVDDLRIDLGNDVVDGYLDIVTRKGRMVAPLRKKCRDCESWIWRHPVLGRTETIRFWQQVLCDKCLKLVRQANIKIAHVAWRKKNRKAGGR